MIFHIFLKQNHFFKHVLLKPLKYGLVMKVSIPLKKSLEFPVTTQYATQQVAAYASNATRFFAVGAGG